MIEVKTNYHIPQHANSTFMINSIQFREISENLWNIHKSLRDEKLWSSLTQWVDTVADKPENGMPTFNFQEIQQ